jgi:hypothetical protein
MSAIAQKRTNAGAVELSGKCQKRIRAQCGMVPAFLDGAKNETAHAHFAGLLCGLFIRGERTPSLRSNC